MDNKQQIPRILSADDLANFRYLLNKYGLTPTDLTITGFIDAGTKFKVGGVSGVTATITIPKITSGGSAGALTIVGGIITAASNPS